MELLHLSIQNEFAHDLRYSVITKVFFLFPNGDILKKTILSPVILKSHKKIHINYMFD